MVAIKISRSPTRNFSNVSNFEHATLISTQIAPKDSTQGYSNVPNSLDAKVIPHKIAPKVETEAVFIRFDQEAVNIWDNSHIWGDTSPKQEKNTSDTPVPNPTARYSVQKPNADDKRLGNYESTLIVFATFSLLISLDMAINCEIC
jgi:hypothetical protein